MYVNISGCAGFLDPINHDEKLTSFSGVGMQCLIRAVVFNNDTCEYDECEEADGSFVMHEVKFSDGSYCYFEVLKNGRLSHFWTNAFAELRDGVLVVSPHASHDTRRTQDSGIKIGQRSRRKANYDDVVLRAEESEDD